MTLDAVSGLPGVYPDSGSPSEEGPGKGKAPAKARAAAGGAPSSGAAPTDSGSGGAASAGQVEDQGTPPLPGEPSRVPPAAAAEPEPATEAAELTFAGKTYKSQADAEQVFRSTLGRLQALERTLTDTRSRLTQAEQAALEAVAVARQYAERLGPAGGQQGQQAVQPQAPEKPWYDDPEQLDLELAQELAEEKGIGNALWYIVRQLDTHYSKRMKDVVAEATREGDQERAVVRAYTQAMQEFYSAADEKDAAGGLKYPELSDGDKETHTAIVNLWKEIDPERKLGKRAVRLAVLDFREGRLAQVDGGGGASQPGAPAPAGAAPSASRPLLDNLGAQVRAASDAVSTGTGTPPAAPRGTQGEGREARLRRSLRESGTVKAKDGFDYGFTP